jgi:type III secretion protein T
VNDIFSALPQLGELLVGYITLIGVCSLRLFIVMFIFPPTADGLLQGVVRCMASRCSKSVCVKG